MGYHFDIQNRRGSSNKVADALSKVPSSHECTTLSTPRQHWDDLRAELVRDPFLTKLQAGIEEGT